MAFKSRAGRSSGVCRGCSEMKDPHGRCACEREWMHEDAAAKGEKICMGCKQSTPKEEMDKEYPHVCESCGDAARDEEDAQGI